VSVGDLSITEGNGDKTFTFVLSLSAASNETVSVDFATSDGTAISSGIYKDYTARTGNAVFTPGTTTKNVAITVKGDTTYEGDDTFNLNLSNPVNVLIGDGQGVATIVNDDPLPTINVDDVAVTEGNSGTKLAGFTISLSNKSAQPVTVTVSTADGTTNPANAGSDYVARSNVLVTIPANTASVKFNVTVKGDITPEANETYYVNLSAASGGSIGDGQGLGTITNDD